MATAEQLGAFNLAVATGDYSRAAQIAQQAGYSPDVVASYVNQNLAGLNLPTDANIAPSVVESLYTPPPPAVDPVAQQYVDNFNALINQGNYDDAARLVKDAELAGYGENAYRAAAVALEANTSLPSEIDFISPEGIANIKSFVDQYSAPTPSAAPTPATPTSGLGAIPTEVGTPAPVTPLPLQTTPNAGQIYGLPALTRQAPTPLTFAPLRRGSTQLRPAMYMPGLTSRAPALGGSGIAAADLRNTLQSMTAAGQTPADVAYMMDVGGVSPAELSAATGMPTGQIQGEYNLNRPGGTFSTTGPTPTGLPQDFMLQTGAYERSTTPTFLTLPEPKTETKAPTPAPADTDSASIATAREGGLIKMAEGGEAMAKLSPAEAGSQFDVSEFIDDQGRLVGGYSRPIRDQYGVITGYDYRPYERDVVFNPRLAEAEARNMSDEEREAARRGLIVRQGMTGVDPYAGGLAGIVAREAMMRNRPQYYSYAKGGDVSDAAQDLASRGRGGDTMLVHMAPHEVAGLNALARSQGTELTINPETGMPEALKLGKLFKQLAPMALGFALGPAGAGIFSSALGAGLAVGTGYTLATGSLQQGIAAGLGAYGGSNLATGLQAAGADAAASSAATQAGGSGIGAGAGGAAAEAAMINPMAPVDYSLVAAPPPSPTSISLTGGTGSGISLTPGTTGFTAAGPAIPGGEQLFTQQVPIDTVNLATGARETALSTVPRTSSVLTSDITGLGSTPTPGSALTGAERMLGDKATRDLATQRFADATGSTLGNTGMAIAGGMGLQSAAEQEAAIKARQAAIARGEAEDEEKYRRLFEATLGQVRTAKQGGLMKLAGGGMTYMEAGGTTGPTGEPRDVNGTGDGMSDSVPASIEGVQEARLADGEFVIPADVVADIGNGSSDAGSKKLYDMMDRIRMARHGTKEQPPEIKAERLMPA